MQTDERIDLNPPAQYKKSSPARLASVKAWIKDNKKVSLPAFGIAFIILLAAVPWSRYHVAGLFIQHAYSIEVNDATANFPVSGASVSVDGQKVSTDASGKATMQKLKAGHHLLKVEKPNYQAQQIKITVPVLKQKALPQINLIATGRQVRINVKNRISQEAVAGAQISVDNITSITDQSGSALVVVRPGPTIREAKITADGFNDETAKIEISDTQIKDNGLQLTPAGKIYFLSKLSGRLDVAKANLDGTDRQTVLAGTGKEDDRNTVLLASSDWHYLALLANRDGTPKLYIINTETDGLLVMDQTSADFSTIGWHGHYFVYTVARHNYNNWQPNAFSIKSYNADSGKLISLANTNASGSTLDDAQYENFWDISLFDNDVVFTRTWYQYPGYLKVTGKQNVLAAIRPDGTNSRQLKSVDAASQYFAGLRANTPKQLEFAVANNDGSASSYFSLDSSGNIKPIDQPKNLDSVATAYLISPSGNETFWREPRDGKNTLLVGDADGSSAKQVATLSDFNAYGWYTDKYLLVSKDSSQLFVMPKAGIKDDSRATKITDYHKPAQDYFGYGGL